MSNATHVPAPFNGFNFHNCKNVELLGNDLIMSVCRERLAGIFPETEQDLQAQGVDRILHLPERDIWCEMKSEIYDRNSFQEWLQLVVERPFTPNPLRTYQLGGVQKTKSDVYLLVNLVSGYVIVAERRPWALFALQWGLKELEQRRLILSAVLNTQDGLLNGETVTRINRIAFGAPVPNAYLIQRCRDEGAYVQVFDARSALMGSHEYAEALAKLKFDKVDAFSVDWAKSALTRGAPDFENIARQFGVQPLATLPDHLLNLPAFPEASRDTVREGGEMLMVCAQDESKMTRKLKLRSGPAYIPFTDETAEYYGGGPREFKPPRGPGYQRGKPRYQLIREAAREAPPTR
jgi:hypothetical protein